MVYPKARGMVAGLLFLSWLGFLFFLVVQSRHLIVLSRPQFLVAMLYVEATVEDHAGSPASQVTVERVVWAVPELATVQPGQKLDVANLAGVRPADGYHGKGTYLLPLWKSQGVYAVPPLPPAPGQAGHATRIYASNEQTQAQLDALVAEKNAQR